MPSENLVGMRPVRLPTSADNNNGTVASVNNAIAEPRMVSREPGSEKFSPSPNNTANRKLSTAMTRNARLSATAFITQILTRARGSVACLEVSLSPKLYCAQERDRDRTLIALLDKLRTRQQVDDAAALTGTSRVEDDPRDLTGARRYLGVYLLGARDATAQFVDLYSRSKNAEAREKYEALLDDLESSFAARTEKMLLDDQSSLDVEIDVLRDRLAREGIKRS